MAIQVIRSFYVYRLLNLKAFCKVEHKECIHYLNGFNDNIYFSGHVASEAAVTCSVFSEIDSTSVTGNQRYVLRDDVDLCFCTSMELGNPVSKSPTDRQYPVWYFDALFGYSELEQLKRRLGICASKSWLLFCLVLLIWIWFLLFSFIKFCICVYDRFLILISIILS